MRAETTAVKLIATLCLSGGNCVQVVLVQLRWSVSTGGRFRAVAADAPELPSRILTGRGAALNTLVD